MTVDRDHRRNRRPAPVHDRLGSHGRHSGSPPRPGPRGLERWRRWATGNQEGLGADCIPGSRVRRTQRPLRV